jgi:hypothetical protein
MPHPSSVAKRDAVNDLALVHVAATVLGGLSAADVPVMLLKGPSIARWLYPPGTVRPASDVDLLVPPHELDEAGAILRQLGWEAKRDPAPHAYTYKRPRFPSIDLHHSFPFVTVPDERCWSVLRAHAVTTTLAGKRVLMPDRTAMATLRCLHALHHGNSERPRQELERALGVTDASLWSDAAALAHELGADEPFGVSLRQSERGACVADALGLPRLRNTRLALGIHMQPRTTAGFTRLEGANSIRELLVQGLRELIPDPPHMRRCYALARRSRLGLALAYLWRPMLIVWQVPAGYRAWRHLRHAADRADRERRGPMARFALGVEVAAAAVRCRWELRRRGIAPTVATARRLDRSTVLPGSVVSGTETKDDVALGRRLAAIIDRVLRHVPGDTRCLVRSVVLLGMLHARGVPADLVMAIRQDRAMAHAWVEVAGIAISTPADEESFVRLAEL